MQSPAELSATRCRLKMQQPKLVEMERAKNECDCECECVCSYIFICGDGIKTIITNLYSWHMRGKPHPPRGQGPSPHPTAAPFAEACAEPFMKPFRGHISCAVLISLLVIIVVVIKNENNKIIKPRRRRPADSGTELQFGTWPGRKIGQSSIDSNFCVDDVVQKAKLLNFVPASHFKCVCAHFNFPARPTHVSGPSWALSLLLFGHKYTERNGIEEGCQIY